MTISSETSKSGPYLGNGSTKIFDYQFKIVDETHLTVIKRDTSGVESTLILNTDYTVADVGQASGGQITIDVAPAVGETITILRNVPFTQETDLENQGAYYAETVEAAFDLMVMRDQQLQEQIDRAVRIPASADPSALDSLVEDIIRLGVSADEIDTVANIAGDVSAVASNIANVTTVANNIAGVNTVAANITDVNTVAAIAGNVNTVAGDSDEINTLASMTGEINTVANIAGAVADVAAIDDDVSTVAANLTDVTNFAKVYLGPKSSDPALRNDSSPLQAGDLYFNTAANEMRVYDGAAWRETSAQSLNMNAKSFTGDGLETEFTLNVAPAIAANVLVWVGGVRQVPGVDYTVSGTTLTFASAPNGAVDTLVIATTAELDTGGGGSFVADLAALKQLNTTTMTAAYLTEAGREGQYILRDASDYTAEIAAADGQGYFIVSDDDPTKVWAAPLHKEIILTELGADPTRTNYSDDALGAAIAISQARGCIPIIVPPGRYKVAGNYTMGPVPIRGVSQGTSPLLQPTFYWDGTGTFLKWDGGTVSSNGTGGGLENAIIYRTGGASGGIAVELFVQDDLHRAGEVKIRDVLITGESTGGGIREWGIGLLVDGRNADTSGGRGVRTVLLDNLRVVRCLENNKYVHFRQVTHLVGNLNIDQASGTGTPGITFDDFWDEIYLKVRGGNVIVNHSGDPDVDTGIDMLLDGVSLTGLDVNYKGIRGNFTGTVLGNITNAAPNFRINSHKADSAAATLVTGTSNMTGDGTTVNMTFDTELIDTNGNFSSNTYFAKCAGVHEIAGHLTLNGLTNDHKTVVVRVSRITSGGSLIDETRAEYNAANMRQMNNIVSVPFYRRMYMEEGELARVRYTVSGGSKTVGQVGHATSQFNFFSARLI